MERISAEELERRVAAAGKPIAAVFVRKGSEPAQRLLEACAQVPAAVAGRYSFVAIDVDRDAARLDQLRIHKVPELILYASGRIVERSEGAMSAAELEALLEYVLANMLPSGGA